MKTTLSKTSFMKKNNVVFIFFTLIMLIACITIYCTKNSESFSFSRAKNYFSPVDFDISMQSDQYPELSCHPQWSQVLGLFRAVYNRFDLTKIPAGAQKIPKVIHCIWLGSELPLEYDRYYRSWIDHHPQWVFVFWTDTPLNYDRGNSVVASFNDVQDRLAKAEPGMRFVVDTQKLTFDNAPYFYGSSNYGERSDILKWEIVYRFGGVYVDTDFECLAPLDPLHTRYDFYTGIQPLDTHMVQLGAALYGAVPHHPILKECVEGIAKNQHIPAIVNKTGPLHFTRCFSQACCHEGRIDIAFPASFFYPCSYEQKGLPRSAWIKPESFAVHHWAGSWLGEAGAVKKSGN